MRNVITCQCSDRAYKNTLDKGAPSPELEKKNLEVDVYEAGELIYEGPETIE